MSDCVDDFENWSRGSECRKLCDLIAVHGGAYGGFITIAIPSWQWLLWEQYSQMGLVSLTVTVKKVEELPLVDGTKPE